MGVFAAIHTDAGLGVLQKWHPEDTRACRPCMCSPKWPQAKSQC